MGAAVKPPLKEFRIHNVMKNKYIAHNLHKINKPERIEKVSFTMSYLKIYQYTAAVQ